MGLSEFKGVRPKETQLLLLKYKNKSKRGGVRPVEYEWAYGNLNKTGPDP